MAGMNESSAARVVMIAHPPEGATAFARSLVELRLAACVQRLTVASTYRWEGAIQDEAEVLLLVKTTRERVRELEAHCQNAHPYDTPELIALEPTEVATAYTKWLRSECEGRA